VAEAADEGAERGRSDSAERTIRVDAQRLDQLVDLVGELVITVSMVNRAATNGDGSRDLRRHMLRLDKITRELQELAGSLRMIPVQGLFRKMARLARDTAKKCGKQVVFEAFGEDTELDKTVVEKVADPLVHLVRNAIDHGLEADPDERTQRGKPGAGRLSLRAFHKSGLIFIEVEDDGRGLNRTAIVEKAIQRGLLRKDEEPEEREIFALICQPGFSTAAKVTAMSGRGVGMDVVKRNIVSMGGSLDIRSESGKGTCFAMKLPLTLAVIDGMLVRAGKERYVIPTLSVVRLVEPRADDIVSVLEAHELLQVQGQSIPLMRLTTLFAMESTGNDCPLAIIAESDGQRVAILVDELLGQQQAVIKSMGHGIGETPGISGCAILSDGRVGLVLDIAGLLTLAKSALPTPRAAKFPADSQNHPTGAWTA
jgi:two-component system, chemotaxis family, sensor kinase CheA